VPQGSTLIQLAPRSRRRTYVAATGVLLALALLTWDGLHRVAALRHENRLQAQYESAESLAEELDHAIFN
jgi:hypothetical protein